MKSSRAQNCQSKNSMHRFNTDAWSFLFGSADSPQPESGGCAEHRRCGVKQKARKNTPSRRNQKISVYSRSGTIKNDFDVKINKIVVILSPILDVKSKEERKP